MDLIGVLINGLVISTVGVILAWLGHGRFQALEARMDRMEDRLDKRIDTLQASVQASIDGLRSDLTSVALAVGARPRTGRSG